jgi:hypothetical protein
MLMLPWTLFFIRQALFDKSQGYAIRLIYQKGKLMPVSKPKAKAASISPARAKAKPKVAARFCATAAARNRTSL